MKNCRPTDSFSFVLRWQLVCNSSLRLYQAFLSEPPTLLTPAQVRPKSFESRRSCCCCCFNLWRTRLAFTCVLGRHVAPFQRALVGSVDSCAEMKRGKRGSECCEPVWPSGHAPSIAFRHLPPDSARFGNATEGALFISAQLSSDAVSALRKVRVLI